MSTLRSQGSPAEPAAAASSGSPEAGSPRILLYGHDSIGIGHLRRSLVVGEALTRALPQASVLIVSSSPCATFFRTPERVEVVKLPAVTRDEDGDLVASNLGGPLETVFALRRAILEEVFRTFEPDALVVDSKPLGLRDEAMGVLREANERGIPVLLGMPDVLGDPSEVAREWRDPKLRWTVEQVYDRICVYGSPEVLDAEHEYDLPPEIAGRMEYVGYVSAGSRGKKRKPDATPHVVVTTGSGDDGSRRIVAYLDALNGGAPWHTTIVPGPLCNTSTVEAIEGRCERPDVTLLRSHPDVPRLIASSDAVVAMAGYNTCAEILRSQRRAVFLPRTVNGMDQAIRAERLSALGHGSSLHELDARGLRSAVEETLSGGPPPTPPNLDGAERMVEILREMTSRA